LDLFLRELAEDYHRSLTGQPARPPAAEQFAADARSRVEWLHTSTAADQLALRAERLAGAPMALELPTDRPRRPMRSGSGVTRHHVLAPALTDEVRQLSRREGVTPALVLRAAFQALLCRHSGQEEGLVGTRVSGRDTSDSASRMGPYENVLVHRANLRGRPGFHEFLARVRDDDEHALACRELPFARLLNALRSPHDPDRSSLVQALFADRPAAEPLCWPGLAAGPIALDGAAVVAVSLTVADDGTAFACALTLDADLFGAETADRLLRHYETLLAEVFADPVRSIATISLGTEVGIPTCHSPRPAPGAAPKREFVAPRTPAEEQVAVIYAELLGVERVGAEDDFFALGGDSLRAARAAHRLRAASGTDLSLRHLFEAPTVAAVAAELDRLQAAAAAARGADWRAEAVLDSAVTAAGLPAVRDGEPRVVLLTGATGFLGAFLLDDMLRQSSARVVCLARASSDAEAGARVRLNLARYGLDPGDRADRIVPLAGDLTLPRLGLSSERFADVAGRVDAVFHNGAHVHFLHPYASLKAANVLGTQEVLRLATTARLKPVQFVSTLSVLSGMAQGRLALESDRNEHPESLDNGYAQSKWVAEQLVWAAADRGVPVSVLRPGRIVWHSRTGALGGDDLFSRAIRACIQIGSVPAVDTYLEMTPVDYVSRAVVRLGLAPAARGKTYHLFNRHYVRLQQLLDWVRAAGYSLAVVPPEQWLMRVQEAAAQDSQDALSALLPLLANGVPFHSAAEDAPPADRGPALDDRNTQAALAGTPVECPPITADSVGRFLARLAAAGLLTSPKADKPRSRAGANGHNGQGHADRLPVRPRPSGTK
jgi:thioester reductase-like protein